MLRERRSLGVKGDEELDMPWREMRMKYWRTLRSRTDPKPIIGVPELSYDHHHGGYAGVKCEMHETRM